MELYYDEIKSSLGMLTIIGNGEKTIRIDFGAMEDIEESVYKWAYRYFDKPTFMKSPESVLQATTELNRYFHHEIQTFSIELEFYGTPFQKAVWQALYNFIPYGTTKSYKDIANKIGNPKAVRAVGGAVNKNPLSIVVPCHRVIGANGQMVGYNGGLDKKEFLLNHENNDNRNDVKE